jgi:hypothetical protein
VPALIDPSAFITNVAAGAAAQKVHELLSSGEESVTDLLEKQNILLEKLLETLSPGAAPDERTTIPLQPYPFTYRVPSYDRPHFLIFCLNSTPIRIDIPGAGNYQKTIGPGWVIADLDGGVELSTTDASNHNVTICFSDETRGVAL